ncbi:MAG: lipase, partial [Alphaproteobacteria bacterium]
PDGLLLITPWAGTATNTPSMREYGSSQPLTRATVRWAQNQYAPDNLADPRLDLATRRDLAGMPATIVVLADIDPSRSEAETLAANLQQAGARVDVRRYAGVTHDFFGLGAYVPRAADAEQDVASALKARYDRAADLAPVSRSRARR